MADAHRYDDEFVFIDGYTNRSCRAQVSLPPALLERKKDELLEAHSPLKFRYKRPALIVEASGLTRSIVSLTPTKL